MLAMAKLVPKAVEQGAADRRAARNGCGLLSCTFAPLAAERQRRWADKALTFDANHQAGPCGCGTCTADLARISHTFRRI